MRRLVVWSALVVTLGILLVPGVAAAACDPFNEYQQRGWGWMYLASFGFGFQTSLTPCVYPLIPITLGIFGARGKGVSRPRALALATAYVAGMGLTYAVLGVVIALIGSQFGTILANPYFVIPIVVIFVVLASSMFGAFELSLPANVQARLNQIGGRGFRGAFAMGLVGGLIAAPCTGPFLLGLLTFVATSRSVAGGGSLLFIYAVGMGVLFWLLAAFAMSLPKSGRWMQWVESAGGILMLLGAIYFLKPLLPFMRQLAVPETWFLVASIAVIALGIAIGALHLSFHGNAWEKARKALGIALVVAGAFTVWSYKLTPKHHLSYVYDEAEAFAKARAEHKGVMVDFAATWCIPCGELELTFGDDEIYDLITDNFVPLKFDVSEDDDRSAELRRRYKAGTLPSTVYLTTEGRAVGRVRRMMEPDEMVNVLKPAVARLRAGAALGAADDCN
jgi:thiol:disulfide interchange protein DsbD